MGFTQKPFVAVFFINHPPNGWSMRWTLPDGDIASARATTTLLAEGLSFLLAQNCVVEWASVRQEGAPYIEWAAIDTPLPALAQWGVVDNDRVGLLWRFDSGTGKYINHLFKAVDDDEITDFKWVRAPFDIPPGPAVRPPIIALATIPELYRYVLALFRDRTCCGKRVNPKDPSNKWWELTPWATVQYRKVSTRAVGSAYRRASWEPRDFTQQPGFTPCGTAVTVLRACYSASCRFFSDGPTQGIRYYWAQPGAAVFPFQSIFWGWARDKDVDVDNLMDPGEFLGPGARTYQLGIALGLAPGIAPDGIEAQFLGQTQSPWGASPITPLIYQIICDFPGNFVAGPGGALVGGDGACTFGAGSPGGGGAMAGGNALAAYATFLVGPGGAMVGGDAGLAWSVNFPTPGGAMAGGDGLAAFTSGAVGAGGIMLGGDAEASWTASVPSAGGAMVGGAGTVTLAIGIPAAGGAMIGGTGSPSWFASVPSAGGAMTGGGSTAAWSANLPAPGGAMGGGSGSLSWAIGFPSPGGATLGGTGLVALAIGLPSTGGGMLGGDGAAVATPGISPAGGVMMGGDGVAALDVNLPSPGGAMFGGDAFVDYFAGVPGDGGGMLGGDATAA